MTNRAHRLQEKRQIYVSEYGKMDAQLEEESPQIHRAWLGDDPYFLDLQHKDRYGYRLLKTRPVGYSTIQTSADISTERNSAASPKDSALLSSMFERRRVRVLHHSRGSHPVARQFPSTKAKTPHDTTLTRAPSVVTGAQSPPCLQDAQPRVRPTQCIHPMDICSTSRGRRPALHTLDIERKYSETSL